MGSLVERFFSMESIKYSLQDIDAVAQRLLPQLLMHKYVALHGDLGAGKTSFSVAVWKCLPTEDRVSSPTFSIINEYRFRQPSGKSGKVFHMDWYRLADEAEAQEAGVEAVFEDPDAALIIIEWPEKAPGLLPLETLHLCFSSGDQPDLRELTIRTQ